MYMLVHAGGMTYIHVSVKGVVIFNETQQTQLVKGNLAKYFLGSQDHEQNVNGDSLPVYMYVYWTFAIMWSGMPTYQILIFKLFNMNYLQNFGIL